MFRSSIGVNLSQGMAVGVAHFVFVSSHLLVTIYMLLNQQKKSCKDRTRHIYGHTITEPFRTRYHHIIHSTENKMKMHDYSPVIVQYPPLIKEYFTAAKT